MVVQNATVPLRAAVVLVVLCFAAGCRTTAAPNARTTVPGAPAVAVLREAPADWQPWIGKHVRIDAPLTISGNRDLGKRGELVASFDGRLYVPTERARPGPGAERVAADNARRRLVIAGIERMPDASDDADWRSGHRLEGVEGLVEARDGGGIAVRVDAPVRPQRVARPAPPSVDGDVRLASFNLENFFNGDGRGGGFPTPRGARTPDELARQLGKLVATIRALDPDIAALMEFENDGYGTDSSIATLVAALAAGGGDWRFVDAGRGPGDNAIRVGLIYRADRVSPVGAPAVLEGGPFGERSRVPLAQGFRAGSGPTFMVVANHLKSKGCAEAEGLDRDQHDGQACWNALRTDSARRMQTWLRSDPTRTGTDLVAIVGDFNSYAMEDPIQALLADGWHDALEAVGVEAPYSFVYDAEAGRLDHALLSPSLAKRVVAAAEWHSNADEAENVGYQDAIGGDQLATPWRSSDHDPLVVGLRLRAP